MMDSKFGLILCKKSSYSNIIYLCNPTTKKCKSFLFHGSYDHFVLAFDPSWSKHHFEVIKVTKISKNYENGGYIFEVFSSKTGRWDRKFTITDRCIDPSIDLVRHNSCFVNGLLYMFERCVSGLVAINCADGSYKRVTLPSLSWCEKVGGLCNSSGSLMDSKHCRGELSIWTLVENENESCWLLRHRINMKDEVKKIFPFDTHFNGFYNFVLLFHLDTIVMRINGEYFWYNLECDELQVDDSMFTVHGYCLLPWSPCYYVVAGLEPIQVSDFQHGTAFSL